MPLPGTLSAASVAVQVRNTLYVESSMGDRLQNRHPGNNQISRKREEIAVTKTTINILDPSDLARLMLPNRVVMAPLTRSRTANDIAEKMTALY